MSANLAADMFRHATFSCAISLVIRYCGDIQHIKGGRPSTLRHCRELVVVVVITVWGSDYKIDTIDSCMEQLFSKKKNNKRITKDEHKKLCSSFVILLLFFLKKILTVFGV